MSDNETRDTIRLLRQAELFDEMERVLQLTIEWFDKGYPDAAPTHAIRKILARVKEAKERT